MAFGKFIPAEEKMITNIYGEQVLLKKPAGYGGLFWGSVYFKDSGEHIKMAEFYFTDLAENNDNDTYDYWEKIDDCIGKHCKKYLPSKGEHHHYQYGFGGDEGDGLIDFWLPKPVKEMPDMEFEIEGIKYVMKWDYSPGQDD
jgi:hypothetical protein